MQTFSPPEQAISPEMDAGYAVSLLLWQELESLLRNEAIVVSRQDDEALHDFRISIRRMRSLISQSRTLFGKPVAKHFLADFKWIGNFTTPVRDLDVLAIKLEDYGAGLPAEYRDNLAIIQSFLQQERGHAYAELQKDLNSHRYQEMIRAWRGYLEKRLAGNGVEKMEPTILEHANRKTWKTYQLVLEEGRQITDASPATALHELRKTCKKLRYLIDFFSDLHEAEGVRRLIRILKKLQNFLGDFQDCEAHLELLTRFQQHARLPANVQISFMLINEFLIAELHRREHEMRGRFDEKFSAFDKPRTHKLMRNLYHPE